VAAQETRDVVCGASAAAFFKIAAVTVVESSARKMSWRCSSFQRRLRPRCGCIEVAGIPHEHRRFGREERLHGARRLSIRAVITSFGLGAVRALKPGLKTLASSELLLAATPTA